MIDIEKIINLVEENEGTSIMVEVKKTSEVKYIIDKINELKGIYGRNYQAWIDRLDIKEEINGNFSTNFLIIDNSKNNDGLSIYTESSRATPEEYNYIYGKNFKILKYNIKKYKKKKLKI